MFCWKAKIASGSHRRRRDGSAAHGEDGSSRGAHHPVYGLGLVRWRRAMIAAVYHREIVIGFAIAATFLTGVIAASGYAAVRRMHTRVLLVDRERDVLALLGEALAATHNPRALLAVILDATVEATEAPGGMATIDGETVASRGSVGKGEPLTLLLADDPDPAALVLNQPPGGFSPEMSRLAVSIVAQGRIALENARLHGVVQMQALTDDLTGLANRRRFMQGLGDEIRRCERFGAEFSIVLADLDDFKRINDRFGHEAGDVVLESVANAISGSVRDVDLAGRIGGEEFAIIVPGTDVVGAVALAERIRDALKRPTQVVPGQILTVTASFGIVSYRDAVTPAELMRAADVALYRAKAEGKNRTVAVEG